MVVANTFGTVALLGCFVLGGFVLSRGESLIQFYFFGTNHSYNFNQSNYLFSPFWLSDISCDVKKMTLCDPEEMKNWLLWGYWLSPMTYGMNAMAVNEFFGKSWRNVSMHHLLKQKARTRSG